MHLTTHRLPLAAIAIAIMLSSLWSSHRVQSSTLADLPTITSVHAGNHQATITWTPVAPQGKVSPTYLVLSNPESVRCRTALLSCVLSPLRNGQHYDIVVRAVFGTALGRSSRSVEVTPATVPQPPSYVVATTGDQAATIHWQAPHGDGGLPILRYRATVNPGGMSCTTVVALSCTVFGLTHGLNFTVQVRASNAMGESIPSLPSPPVQAGLAPVTGVAVHAANGPTGLSSATIEWMRIPKFNVTYVATSSDGASQCVVVDETSCTARINGLLPVSFSVTGHTTTPYGLPLSTLPSLPSATLPVRVVVLLAGQSNATGVAALGSGFSQVSLSTPAEQQSSLVWDPFDYLPVPKRGWLPMSTPQQAKGAVTASFGPEVGLARAVLAETHRPLAVVKVTYGGTGLARGWNPARTNGLYAEMIRFTKRQLVTDQSAGVVDVLRGFVWFQGENDALSLSDAAEYLNNLTAFIHATRAALPWAAGATTVLISQSSAISIAKRINLGFCGDSACADEVTADALVRSADRQVAVNLPGISVVDSLGYPRANDAVHLTAESELAIGEATARALGPALGLPQEARIPSRRGAHQ